MEKCEDNFDKWLASILENFVSLQPDQQKSTLIRLVSVIDPKTLSIASSSSQHTDDPQHSYFLMHSVLNILHVDMLKLLPTELSEMICSHLDGKSLLKACCVNRNWNRIISSVGRVWQTRCIAEGFENIDASDWKGKFVKGLRILENLKPGRALVIHTLPVEVFNGEIITTLTIYGDLLFAGSGSQVSVWQISPSLNEKPMKHFNVTSAISSIYVYSAHDIVCGHSSGEVSTWLWKDDGNMEETKYFPGHQGVVHSAIANSQLGLLASGGSDGKAKLWCLCSACLLLELHQPASITQVIIIQMNDLDSSGNEEFSLLSATKNAVSLDQCVIKPSTIQKSCEFCSTKEIECVTTSTHVAGFLDEILKNSFDISCHLVRKNMFYSIKSGQADEVAASDYNKKIKRVLLDGVYQMVAVGKSYVLLMDEDRIPRYSFTLFNLDKYRKSATWKFQAQIGGYSRQYFRMASGNTLWLDDLSLLIANQPVLTFTDRSDEIKIVFWEPYTPPT